MNFGVSPNANSSYRSNIHTEGVVYKIKNKCEGFMHLEFNVGGTMGQVG